MLKKSQRKGPSLSQFTKDRPDDSPLAPFPATAVRVLPAPDVNIVDVLRQRGCVLVDRVTVRVPARVDGIARRALERRDRVRAEGGSDDLGRMSEAVVGVRVVMKGVVRMEVVVRQVDVRVLVGVKVVVVRVSVVVGVGVTVVGVRGLGRMEEGALVGAGFSVRRRSLRRGADEGLDHLAGVLPEPGEGLVRVSVVDVVLRITC